ncbi:hypothetical protein HID58_007127 [Brassica napus]|uniref:Uncharacterized protein n=1 Tax=Brassica napus TaxID=3708 RepID=A0ABQ8EG96_BRANA|nr:hypothetical protein HID58_007127 [Brassica napus]
MDLFSAPYDTNETGVFWDFDECGHRGPVSIQIYGDLTGLDFQSSDIKLNHFHSGEKREKMTKILEDIVSWSGENPEPSVGLLALGDVGDAGDDIVEVVELLKSQKNYSGCDRSLLGHGRMQEIPEELTAADVVPRIRQKLLDLGLRGPVSIRIYGDLTGLDFQSSEDVKLHHFHAGEKREKMTKILEDIVSWSGENPEPSVGILVLGHLGAADDVTSPRLLNFSRLRKTISLCL